MHRLTLAAIKRQRRDVTQNSVSTVLTSAHIRRCHQGAIGSYGFLLSHHEERTSCH